MKFTIHCNPLIPWQKKRGAFFVEGLKKAGHQCEVAEIQDGRQRRDGFPVLLGTTFWRGIENDGGEYLLVDRCSFGDTDVFVSLVYNGHGRRGDHRIPENFNGERWERYGDPILPWRAGTRRILCGQTEAYAPDVQLEQWYASVRATHFRPHPAGENQTGLPVAADFENCQCAITLNSSVGVKAVLAGTPLVTMDEGAMAWDVSSHDPEVIVMPEREPWAHRLAWTQWTDDEVREGAPWEFHW